MSNFKKETLLAIKNSGHVKEDVMFIGSADGEYRIGMDKFLNISNFEYDSGYGGQEIASDLIVYFYDHTYMTRHEYDGSERWDYLVPKVFRQGETHKDINTLGGSRFSWKTVEEMNNKEKYDEEGYERYDDEETA